MLAGSAHGSAIENVVNPGWCAFMKLFADVPVTCGTSPANPVCVAGTTRCNSAGKLQTCTADKLWGPETTCAISCVRRSPTLASCGNPKFVFTTSSVFAVTELGGLAGADTRCQERAAAVGLPGQYKAWLSDSKSSPSTRFSRAADPYMLVDGTIVADSWADLTSGALQHAINLTELRGAPPAGASLCEKGAVWTATTAMGALEDPSLTCGDWTNAQGTQTQTGAWSGQDVSWTAHCTGGNTPQNSCGTANALYCFQQ